MGRAAEPRAQRGRFDRMNEEARAKVERRQRVPALAFLVGALLVGALALAVWLFWPDRAEAPATPQEAIVTDDLDLPAPDAGEIRRQVDEALSTAPAASNPPATAAPEGVDSPVEASPPRRESDSPPPLPRAQPGQQ